MLLGMRSPKVGPTPVGAWRASTSTLAQLAALVSHSRTSLATMFDSTGKLTYAPNNLLTQSNTFSNAAWVKASGGTGSAPVVTPNNATGPDGTANAASTVAFNTGAGTSSSDRSILSYTSGAASVGVSYLGAVYVKGSAGAKIQVRQNGAVAYSLFTLTGGWDWLYTKETSTVTTNAVEIGIRQGVNGTINSSITVQIAYAALSAVTYETSPRTADQVITTAAAYYGPRIDYAPNTLAVKGLLIEEARTNLLVNSKSDGTNLATQNVTVTAQPYTLTFYGTGSVTLSGASTSGPLSGSGAFPTRSTLTFTPSAGTLTLTVAGTVQYAQLEAGSFATSYIPTDAASVTRAADVVQFTGAALTALQGSAGSAIGQVTTLLNTSATKSVIGAGALNNSMLTFANTTAFTWSSAATPLTAPGLATLTSDRMGVAWSGAGRSVVLNGGAVASDANTISGVSDAYLGSIGASSYSLNGWIKSFAVYNQRLPDATLQAKSVVNASY